MIYNNDSVPFADVSNYHQEDKFLLPAPLHSYGVAPFLVQSLEKIKKNVKNKRFRNLIHNYIREHTMTNKVEEVLVEKEESTFAVYAKLAYQKAMKEEEYLRNLIHSLETETIPVKCK